MSLTRSRWIGLVIIVIVASAALAFTLTRDSSIDDPAPPTWPGRYTVDVLRTVNAATEAAGGPVQEAWIDDLSPRTHWLQLTEEGTFELNLGAKAMQLSITGTWVEVKEGLAITPTAVNGQALAAETRKTDTVLRDGDHLVVSQGTYGLYLRRATP